MKYTGVKNKSSILITLDIYGFIADINGLDNLRIACPQKLSPRSTLS
jgi:hypothetical protein